MTQWDKLLNRIYALSKDLRFHELRKVLESYGYQESVCRTCKTSCRKRGAEP